MIVSKLRFLGLTGLVFPFTLATGGGFALKVALLTFGMTTFLATALLRIVDDIPDAQIDYVRGLGASRARVIWEVLVRGTLDRMLDAARQNIAMGWSMITMVEGIARSDGGVGAVLLAENKHFRLSEVYAILIVVLLVGLAIDFAMAALERALCPYSNNKAAMVSP
jgi:NitT/TauT family transport system permease protein